MSDRTDGPRRDGPGLMRAEAAAPRHWWGRRLPSVAVLALVLVVAGTAVFVMIGRAATVLPEVGKDRLGDDNWKGPLGVELAGGFQVGRVPNCAAGAFTRIVLWDPDSSPYWEVEGPPTPLTAFLVGVAPDGFTTVTPFRDPPRGAVLRLVAFRRDGGPVGIRYQAVDLREKRVMSGVPLMPFTVEGFLGADVCSSVSGDVTTPDVDGAEADDRMPTTSTMASLGPGAGRSTTTIDDGTGVEDD